MRLAFWRRGDDKARVQRAVSCVAGRRYRLRSFCGVLTAQARAVVVPDASMADDARTLLCDQLKAVGFTEVTMLSKPSEPLNALEPGPRVAAA